MRLPYPPDIRPAPGLLTHTPMGYVGLVAMTVTATSPPTGLTRVAIVATAHCLTGCAIGEILGLVIATAIGLSNAPSIALAIALAFVFGYALTIGPLVRGGVPFRQA